MQEHDRPSDEALGFSAISMVLALFLSVIIIGETVVVTMFVVAYEREHLPHPADYSSTPAP